MPPDPILDKCKDLQQLFLELGLITDKESCFENNITTLFSEKELKKVVDFSVANQSLSPSVEAEFYYHTCKYCANTRNFFLVSLGMVASTIQNYGTKWQRDEFGSKLLCGSKIGSLAITEPNAGSNLDEISTSYEIINDNEFRINGCKRWITLGGIASIVLLAATGEKGLQLFIVETSKHKIERREYSDLLCNRGSHIAELTFKNMKLSRKHLLGENFKSSAEALRFALMSGRAIASISAVAMSHVALEEAISFANKRKQFGKRITEHQLIQKMISEAWGNIHAGKYFAIEAFKAKRNPGLLALQTCANAKLFTSKAMQKITSDCIQIIGSAGISNEFSAERYYREAKAFEFIEGTTQVLEQVCAHGAISKTPKLW